jgi:hypothetical protein
MPRSFRCALLVTLFCSVVALVVGCGESEPQWVKTVEVSAVIEDSKPSRRFEDGRAITIELAQGGELRFVATAGAVGGYGATDDPEFHYLFVRAVEAAVPPESVELDATVTTESGNAPDDVKVYELQTVAPLEPGTYSLVYDGAGSVSVEVYVKQ